MKRSEINDFIRDNYNTFSDEELAAHCGVTKEAIRGRRRAMGLRRDPVVTPHDALQAHVVQASERAANRLKQQQIELLLEENAKLATERDAALFLRSNARISPITARRGAGGEATIIALLSDTHIEETVKPEQTNNLGKYTLEIAEKRFQQYFATLLRLIEIEQQNTQVHNLVLFLGGDFISGDIHEELLETCSLPPVEAALLAQNWIASGIRYLLDNSKLQISIVCHSGNHARTTKKIRHATEAGHSLEYMMYRNLAYFFQDETRLKWEIATGYLSFLQVYEKTIAFHHGHNVKYNGGSGGVTISMNKAIAQWSRSKQADIWICGHFHQAFDGGNFVINGSMIGYSPFAVAIKAAYEPPSQVMFALHSKRGNILTRRIYFDV